MIAGTIDTPDHISANTTSALSTSSLQIRLFLGEHSRYRRYEGVRIT